MIRFRVYGTPVPQGSMKHIGGGRVIHTAAGKLKRWRAEIERVAVEVGRNRPAIDGACMIDVEFILERPKSRRKALFADRRPDLDKLQRGVGDALESVLYTQDSRVVGWNATKRYAEGDELPGVWIELREMA